MTLTLKNNSTSAARFEQNSPSSQFNEYIRKFEKLAVLPEEEIVRLINDYQTNGTQASIDKVVSHNMMLVVKIAQENRGMGVALPDLVSEGVMGMLQAVVKYNEEKAKESNSKFVSYARWWIHKYMKDALENAPVVKSQRYYRRKKNGGKATTVVSVHEKVTPDGETEFADMLMDERPNQEEALIATNTMNALLEAVDNALSERERYIVTRIYGLDGDGQHTLEDVAQEIGKTRERVRQILGEAQTKIKGYANSRTREEAAC